MGEQTKSEFVLVGLTFDTLSITVVGSAFQICVTFLKLYSVTPLSVWMLHDFVKSSRIHVVFNHLV